MKKFLKSNTLSEFLTLNSLDFIKGISLAVIASVIDTIILQLNDGKLDYAHIGITASVTALAYLKLRFLSNTKGLFGPEK